MKRWLILVGVFALVTGIVSGLAIAKARSTSLQREKVLRFFETTVKDGFLDVPPALDQNGSPQQGDTFFFRDALWNPDQTERRGNVYGSCEFIFNFVAQCEGTALLRKGNVVFEGAVRFPDGNDPERLRFAVTGGTRLYKNAVGEIVVRPIGDTGTERVAVHLIPSFKNPD